MATPPGILAEHQGVDRTPEPTGYTPSEQEQRAIRLVDRLFMEGKRAKNYGDIKRLEYYKAFKGRQWEEKRPSYRHSEVLNFIFSEVQTVLVILTDSRPNIEVLPEDPTDTEFANIISEVIRSKWESKNWSYVLAEAIVDAAVYGTAIGKVLWDPEAEQGLGDIKFETVDPFLFFPDPHAKSSINNEYCDHVVEAEPLPVRRIKRQYDNGEFVKPDLGDLNNYNENRENLDEYVYKSPTDNRVRVENQSVNHQGRGDDTALKLCAYVKSDETIEEEIEGPLDEETGLQKKLYQQRLKYPNGKKVETASGVLLSDEENPYADGKFPYAKLTDYILPREFWGSGEVEQLLSPQRIVNKLISHTLDTLTIMGNPIWVVDSTSGINTDLLTNQPGLAVVKEPGTEARREAGVGLQPFVMETLQFMTERVLRKLGSSDDVSPTASDQMSGYAINQIREAAQTKLRGKSRNVEVFLKDSGDLMVSRILQFYGVPRIVRLNSNPESAKYFKVAISAVDDETGEVQKMAEVQEYAEDPTTGAYIAQDVKYIPLKSSLDVRVGVGSTLPMAKLERRMMADKLFDKKVIDVEEYLTQLDYPNKERVLQRLRDQAAAMPQEAVNGTATQAPAGAGPGPAPEFEGRGPAGFPGG